VDLKRQEAFRHEDSVSRHSKRSCYQRPSISPQTGGLKHQNPGSEGDGSDRIVSLTALRHRETKIDIRQLETLLAAGS